MIGNLTVNKYETNKRIAVIHLFIRLHSKRSGGCGAGTGVGYSLTEDFPGQVNP
jgi:hypothetical protein